jgi:DNA-binding FadR family transcriptional regulator
MKKNQQNLNGGTTLTGVTKALQDFILDNHLTPGSSLPSEKELGERLQVSRTVLREALQRFKVMGIIESRRKAGMIIKQLHPENLYESFIPFIDVESAFEKLLDMRIILELGMAEMLVERMSGNGILELEIIAVRMREATDGKEMIELDNAFHRALFESIGNEFLNSIRGLTIDFFTMTYERTANESLGQGNHENHMAIVNALRKKDLDLLRSAIKNHYDVYR